MQPSRLAWSGYYTVPDIQAIRLFAMLLQFLESFLYPLPILLLFLLGEGIQLWMLLRVALKHARADKIDGVAHGMHECFRIVDKEPSRRYALPQPLHEVFAGRLCFRNH